MSRVVRRLLPLAAVFVALVPAASAEAADLVSFPTYGANSAILRSTGISVCDGEDDAYAVEAQVRWVPGQTYRYQNWNGAVTCKRWDFGGTFHPVSVRVCETLRRTGVSGCGAWVVRIPTA